MKKLWILVLKKWEYKREQKKKIALFLKTYNLRLIKKRETSIILGCFIPVASSTKKGKFDLTDTDGNVLDVNLSELEVSKKMEAYTKAAKKEGVSVGTYIKKKVLDEKVVLYTNKNRKFLNDNNLEVIRRSGSTKNIELIDVNTNFIKAFGEKNIDKFILLNKNINKNKLIKEGKLALKNDVNKKHLIYNQSKTPEIPTSEFGTSPDFEGLNAWKKNGHLGDGIVPENGIEDLANISKYIENNNGKIKTFVTGNRSADFKNCWRAMGVTDEKLINKYQKISENIGLTWHHLDDLDIDLKGTFQIVITDLHVSTINHMGSFAQLKQIYSRL